MLPHRSAPGLRCTTWQTATKTCSLWILLCSTEFTVLRTNVNSKSGAIYWKNISLFCLSLNVSHMDRCTDTIYLHSINSISVEIGHFSTTRLVISDGTLMRLCRVVEKHWIIDFKILIIHSFHLLHYGLFIMWTQETHLPSTYSLTPSPAPSSSHHHYRKKAMKY